jgi:mannose-1-phosphate guanylyltransferase
MKAMVLAAGVGSRLDPLTASIPKPLVPVANIPVMEHILQLLKKHGVEDVCANLHYLPDALTNYFGDGAKFGVNIQFEYESKLSGDAGGVRACRSFLEDGTFLVIMGDLITDCDLSALVAEHKRKKSLASIGVKQMDDVSRFGVVMRDGQGFITGFQEKPAPEEALSNLISTGIYIFEPEVFNHIPATGDYGFGRQLFPKLVADGLPVLGIEVESYWSDVGTVDQYRESNLDALSGLVKLTLPGLKLNNMPHNVRLEQGAQLDPASVLQAEALVGKNSKVSADAVLKGRVIIGDDCVIEAGCEVSDSVLWSGAHIQANCQISRSVVGTKCLVKKGTRLNQTAVDLSVAGAR